MIIYTGHILKLDDLNTCAPSTFKMKDTFVGIVRNPPSNMCWVYSAPSHICHICTHHCFSQSVLGVDYRFL